MATISVATNPVVTDWPGNSAPARVKIRAADSVTWKAGELGYLDGSGHVTPVAGTGVTDAQYRFCETQATATSSSDVWVQALTNGCRLRMFVMTDGSSAAETALTRGTSYGVEAASNITHIDSGTASGKFKVVRFGSEMNEYEMTATMTPGIVLAEYTG